MKARTPNFFNFILFLQNDLDLIFCDKLYLWINYGNANIKAPFRVAPFVSNAFPFHNKIVCIYIQLAAILLFPMHRRDNWERRAAVAVGGAFGAGQERWHAAQRAAAWRSGSRRRGASHSFVF